MSFADVNFLAVSLATVLAFGLGALWYSPLLFARPWMTAHGYSAEKMKQMQAGAAPAYAVSFVCWFGMTTVLALVAPHFGESVGIFLHMGLLFWLGFSATTGLTTNMFSAKPLRLWVIDAGYQVVSVTIMAIVLGLWR